MRISFKNVVPIPMKELITSESFIWDKEFSFSQDINYQISARSGVGKTTLLSLIYGIRHDYSGDIVFDDISIRSFNKKDWAKLRKEKVSMVFQGLQLFDKLSVKENIFIKNQLTDFLDEPAVLQMLKQLEIDNLYNKMAGEISFGQKQRVAIIRALCQPFNLIMLDEPFSHLDSDTTQTALNLLIEQANNQSAKIFISSLSPKPLSSDFEILKM